jgi:DNA-directed RNA polymerase specialized sigma24 family protein
MEKIDFINYRLLAQEVKRLKVRLDALEASIYSPTSQRYSLTPRGSSGGRTMDDVIASHANLEEFYRTKLAEKNTQLLAVEQAIDGLADPGERLVMRYRYIDGRSWRQICTTMQSRGYSERQVYRLHGYALEKLRER